VPRALTAVFRVDASVETGGGHVRRCIVLAKSLMRDGWSVHFASSPDTAKIVPSSRTSGIEMIPADNTRNAAGALRDVMPGGCDLLVVDHYGLDEKFERTCRPWARRILVIDDLADRRHDCDVLVDQSPGRLATDYWPLVPPDCIVLAGSVYALLDERFAGARARASRRDGAVRRILVSLGATDPKGATLHVLAALKRMKPGIPVDVVLGACSPHQIDVHAAAKLLVPPAESYVEVDDMAALIERADLAIGAGGVSALERCCLGVPSLLVVLAENQQRNAAALEKMGAAAIVDEARVRNIDAFADSIHGLLHDRVRLAAMSVAAAKVTDGLGTMRVQRCCYPPSLSAAHVQN